MSNYLEKLEGMSDEDIAKKASERLGFIKSKKKELDDEEKFWKAWLRKYAEGKRTNDDKEEAEEVAVYGTVVGFKRPTPKNFGEAEAKEIRAKFIEVLGDEGEKTFKEFFERKVEYKPVNGFVDKYFALGKGIRRRINSVIPWKTNTPEVK